mgnify:CR=1 FL=1
MRVGECMLFQLTRCWAELSRSRASCLRLSNHGNQLTSPSRNFRRANAPKLSVSTSFTWQCIVTVSVLSLKETEDILKLAVFESHECSHTIWDVEPYLDSCTLGDDAGWTTAGVHHLVSSQVARYVLVTRDLRAAIHASCL